MVCRKGHVIRRSPLGVDILNDSSFCLIFFFFKAGYRITWLVKILSLYLCVCMCLDKGLLTKILTVGGTEMVFTSRNCLTFYKKALYLFLLLFNFETSLFICLWLGWVFCLFV